MYFLLQNVTTRQRKQDKEKRKRRVEKHEGGKRDVEEEEGANWVVLT